MTPARELARGVIPHVEMAKRMLGQARGRRVAADVAAALSEAAGLAGWLHTDMCDHGAARFYYRLAADAAHHAGHDLLAGYMLGSLAAFEMDTGDYTGGLGLIARVIQRSRIFRRDYAGPVTSSVQAFDRRVHATFP